MAEMKDMEDIGEMATEEQKIDLEREILDTVDMSRILGRPIPSIRILCRTGQLPCFRVGKSRFYSSRSAIIAWVNQQIEEQTRTFKYRPRKKK
jgi:hypothetical protein